MHDTEQLNQDGLPKNTLRKSLTPKKMGYVVVYDKFLENTTWLLNARKTFKEKKEAITFARDCEHSAYTANVKVYEL